MLDKGKLSWVAPRAGAWIEIDKHDLVEYVQRGRWKRFNKTKFNISASGICSGQKIQKSGNRLLPKMKKANRLLTKYPGDIISLL
jgi:hypothetical protein